MKNKEIHYPFYCKKCTRTVYYSKNDVKDDMCKCCGNKMEAWPPIISHHKDTLKNVNHKGSCLTTNLPIVECPYCHSTNTRKLSGFAKLGILSWGASPKEWHCNRCDSDF